MLVHNEPHLGMVIMRNIATEVSTKLRKANHLTVSVQRRGQNTTMDYTIR